MSDQEQQLEEFEVLESIYPDEFRRIDRLKTVPAHWEGQAFGHVFQIDLKPSDADSKEVHVHVHLICGMPPNYPTEVPLLVDIVPKKGLGPDQVQELMVIAERTAAENLGMPSAYSIAMAVQEWLTENNLPGNDGSMYAEMLRREQKKVVEDNKEAYKAAIKQAVDSERRETQVDEQELERQRRRQAGQPVTLETFNAWKIAFELEMAAKRSKKDDSDESKPSGKQYFLAKQAAGQSTEDDEEQLLADGERDDFIMEDLEGEEYEEGDEEDGEEGEEGEEGEDATAPRKAGAS
eukprot:gene11255-8000_t